MSATGSNSPKITIAEFNQRKKRRELTYPMVTDDDTRLGYQLAEQALARAKMLGDPQEITQAQKLLREAEAEVRAATMVMRLRALPREGDNSYKVLLAEHPPTKADNEKLQEDLDDPKAKAVAHMATFGPALVAACLIEPEVTVEQATEWWREWNDGEWNGLVNAARAVNEQRTDTAGLVFS